MTVEGYLARHGETDWNKLKKIQGQTDVPLSAEGIKQAEELAVQVRELGISVIHSSPLLRAIHTSRIVSDHLRIPIISHDGLKERSYGEFEGKLFDEVNAEFKRSNATLKLSSPKDGESYSNFRERVLITFTEIVQKHKDGKILLVCHGGVLEVLTQYLQKTEDKDGDNDDIGYAFANASIRAFLV